MLVFPLERSITLKGYSVRRKQVPIYLAFCLTDYKKCKARLLELLSLTSKMTLPSGPRSSPDVLLNICATVPSSILQGTLSPAVTRHARPIRTRSSTDNWKAKTPRARKKDDYCVAESFRHNSVRSITELSILSWAGWSLILSICTHASLCGGWRKDTLNQ